MNIATNLFVLMAVCSIIWFVVATILIYDNLRRRGQKVSFIWLRAMAPFYASRYKELTKKETGKVGILFYHWLVSINLTLVLTLSALAFNYL